jgi:hypothetical protein
MQRHGAERIYAKLLSANDNSKNQVYLGGDFGVLSVLPATDPLPGATGTRQEPIFKAGLNLQWLDDSGSRHTAPKAQLILYPQYPEVRMSGFLQGAEWAPRELMTQRTAGRLLVLGVGKGQTILAYVVPPQSTAAQEFQRAGGVTEVGVLVRLRTDRALEADPQKRLLDALCKISQKGWITPWRLGANGERHPCKGTNCVGVTLESELGITSNGRAEPDFDGWEVKAHTVSSFDSRAMSILTLMTPEPTTGFYVSHGVEAFVRKYGYRDKKGKPDRLNFGGVHRVGEESALTKLRLQLNGFDAETSTMTDAAGSLVLLDRKGEVAAGWDFAGLLAHWKRKHSRTAYVPAIKLAGASVKYAYSDTVALGVGTDYIRFLDGLATGAVYYDPGIKVENANTRPTTKRRSQFRIRGAQLSALYESFTRVRACGGARA